LSNVPALVQRAARPLHLLSEENRAMLVLTRKMGEKILIGDDVAITVLAVKDNRVRLGLSAPENVSILRLEVVFPPDQSKDKHTLGSDVSV
jgi:carbon storage regulator